MIVHFLVPFMLIATAAAVELPSLAELGLPPAALTLAGTRLPAATAAPAAVEVCFSGRSYRCLNDRYVDDAGVSWKALVATTTAYVPVAEQCDGDPEHTATGTKAQLTYGVAADPRALPYGTVLRIPGYGDVPVDDTGSRMVRSWKDGKKEGKVHLDLRIPFRGATGVFRDPSTCNRIALKHGLQRDRVVLVRVPDAAVAVVARGTVTVQ